MNREAFRKLNRFLFEKGIHFKVIGIFTDFTRERGECLAIEINTELMEVRAGVKLHPDDHTEVIEMLELPDRIQDMVFTRNNLAYLLFEDVDIHVLTGFVEKDSLNELLGFAEHNEIRAYPVIMFTENNTLTTFRYIIWKMFEKDSRHCLQWQDYFGVWHNVYGDYDKLELPSPSDVLNEKVSDKYRIVGFKVLFI